MGGGATSERHLTPQGEDRKAEIVREAERLFTERGFRNTRMSDIADAAGVTKGLLYWYFENKQALLAEIVVDMRSRLQQAQREAASAADDPLGKMYLSTVASVKFIRENQHIYGLINYSAVAFDLGPAAIESTTVHARDTARLIEEGQKQGVIRNDDTAANLAHGNAGVVNNYCAAAALGHLKVSHDELGHIAARYIVRALAARPELADAVDAAHGAKATKRKPARRVAKPGVTLS